MRNLEKMSICFFLKLVWIINLGEIVNTAAATAATSSRTKGIAGHRNITTADSNIADINSYHTAAGLGRIARIDTAAAGCTNRNIIRHIAGAKIPGTTNASALVQTTKSLQIGVCGPKHYLAAQRQE